MSTPSHPERDRLLVRDVYGEARHHAPRCELTADGRAAAAAAAKQGNRAEPARAGQS